MKMTVKQRFSADIPTGWGVILLRSIEVAVVAFLVLQAKEWFDAGTFDVPGTAADAGLIAAGVFLLNAILMLAKR
jgi:hypothetical protein